MRARCRPTAVLPEPMGPMRNILPLPNIKYAQHTNLVLESSGPLWGGVRQNANPVGFRSGPVLQFGLEQADAGQNVCVGVRRQGVELRGPGSAVPESLTLDVAERCDGKADRYVVHSITGGVNRLNRVGKSILGDAESVE